MQQGVWGRKKPGATSQPDPFAVTEKAAKIFPCLRTSNAYRLQKPTTKDFP
jgi:hypothetical protein